MSKEKNNPEDKLHVQTNSAVCPLCSKIMDFLDKNKNPCQCGHQICLLCDQKLKKTQGCCPKCKKQYQGNTTQNVWCTEEIKKIKTEQEKKASFDLKETKTSLQQKIRLRDSRKHLTDLRVIQKTLVYAIGIDISLAEESILRQDKYFGQFGTIIKIVINTRSMAGISTGVAVYVTYTEPIHAERAIKAIDKTVYKGRVVRATYGTTKYCSFFLRGLVCPNSECMYLHETGDNQVSFTKEQMNTTKHHMHSFTVDKETSAGMNAFGKIYPIESQTELDEKNLFPFSDVFGVSILSTRKEKSETKFNPFSGVFPLTLEQIKKEHGKETSSASLMGKEADLNEKGTGRFPGIIGEKLSGENNW